MTPSETADLLARMALIDSRPVDELTVATWHDAIKDLDAADALEAVNAHYRESTEWLMPAHLRARVKAARAARSIPVDQLDPPPGLDPDDVPAYLDWLRRELTTVAGGGERSIPPQGKRTMAELPAVNWPKAIPPRESKVGAEESRRLAQARAEVEKVRAANEEAP